MKLFRGIAATVQSVDIFDQNSVRHITDLMWEMRAATIATLLTQLIDGRGQLGLEKVLRRLVVTTPLDEMMFTTNKTEELARGYVLKRGAIAKAHRSGRNNGSSNFGKTKPNSIEISAGQALRRFGKTNPNSIEVTAAGRQFWRNEAKFHPRRQRSSPTRNNVIAQIHDAERKPGDKTNSSDEARTSATSRRGAAPSR